MELNCIEILINDDDLGCQVIFSEKKDLGEETENMTVNEIIESIGRYLLLQRSYPEDDYASGNYYFETHDKKLSGNLIDYEMILSRSYFELNIQNEKIEISINPTKKEFFELIKVLTILTNKNGRLIINDWKTAVANNV